MGSTKSCSLTMSDTKWPGVLSTHSGKVPRAFPGGRFHVEDSTTTSSLCMTSQRVEWVRLLIGFPSTMILWVREDHNLSSILLMKTELRRHEDNTASKCYTRCPNPPAGKEKTSMTMQHAKEGKFISDSSQGPCCNQCSGAKSESPEPQFPHTFTGCSISNISCG